MNVKPIAYHWTNEKKANSILNEGLKISGGLHMNGAYMTANSAEFLGWKGKTHLLGVDLRGIETRLVLMPNKKWIISTDEIPKEHIFYIGTDFESEQDVHRQTAIRKQEFQTKYHKGIIPLKKDRLKVYEQPQIAA